MYTESFVYHSAGVLDASGYQYSDASGTCRSEPHTEVITTSEGYEIASSTRIFTISALKVGDRVPIAGREWPVREVRKRTDITGLLSHYEVLL